MRPRLRSLTALSCESNGAMDTMDGELTPRINRRSPVHRRFLAAFAAAVLAATSAAPASAKPQMVAQKSEKHFNVVTLMAGLVPGNRYRLEVTSPQQRQFKAAAFQSFTAIKSGSMYTGHKSLSWKGTTPARFEFAQPSKASFTQWLFA